MRPIRRRTSIISVLLLCGATALFSQIPERIGPHVGLNFANADRSGFPEGVSFTNKVRTGIVAGAVVEWTLSNYFLLQCEPLYVQKGSHATETFYFAEEAFSFTAEARFDYVAVPVILKFRIPAPGIKPYLLTGPNLGYRTSAEVESGGQVRDYKNRTEAIDFAWDIGGGVEQNLAPFVSLLVDFRFSYGFVNVIKRQSPTDATTWRSRDFKLAATFLFGL
jgi:opacity protein-like surface antigen